MRRRVQANAPSRAGQCAAAVQHAPPNEVATVEHRRVEAAHESLLALARHERRLVNDAADAFRAAPLFNRGKLPGRVVHIALPGGEEACTFLLTDRNGCEAPAQEGH